MKSKLLIVEDQFIEANNLRIILKRAGYAVCTIARSVPEALIIVEKERPDMVLVDIYLDGPRTGIDLAHLLAEKNIAFVFLSANSNQQTLNAAKATNPYGFLVKPFREKDVLVMLEVALYGHSQKLAGLPEGPGLPEVSADNNIFKSIIGSSESLRAVLSQIEAVGGSEASILIMGESGTGKELAAKAVHQVSGRRSRPLVVVNCAALPANLIESELFGHEKGAFTGASEKRVGKFEQADGGTVFLDEIGELPLDLQVKFLRVLQEKEIEPIGGKKKEINVRVIAATNRNLVDEMAAGRFRMDLYYRLNVFPINLPPLRERQDDIRILAEYFLKQYAEKEKKLITGFTDGVINSLLRYPWPGNIRELENIIARSVLLSNGRLITSVALPQQTAEVPKPNHGGRLKTLEENERDHIIAALERCEWKIYGTDGAAAMLAMNGNTLHSRMKKLGIEKQISLKRPPK